MHPIYFFHNTHLGNVPNSILAHFILLGNYISSVVIVPRVSRGIGETGHAGKPGPWQGHPINVEFKARAHVVWLLFIVQNSAENKRTK